jgi:hypothetical protein
MTIRLRQTNRDRDVKADEIEMTNDILLDEDEQEALIQQIHEDYLQQSERLEKVFTIICRLIVPILSLMYTILLHHLHQKSNHRNISTTKPSHQADSTNRNLSQNVITVRCVHLILNFIIHWYIPKAIFRKPKTVPLLKNATGSTTTTTIMAKSGGSETAVSFTLWYGVYLPYCLTILIMAIAHWMIRQRRSHLLLIGDVATTTTEDALENYYHLTLCSSATIFLLSAWYIQQDHHENIHKTIHDLKSYKYQYKSL